MTSTVQTASAPFVEKAPLEAYVAPEKPSLVGLSREQLADALGAVGVPPAQRKMRVQQLWHWIYYRGSTSFDDMTTMSKDLRTALAERYTVARPEVVAEQVSVDGTRKWLLRLEGDADSKLPHDVECVYIPDTERGTLCVSSQVGCTLTCTFCHTGTQRLVRNLTAGEIAGQVLAARDRLGDWPGGTRPTDGVIPTGDRCVTNIVMMGMGEPLYNFDAVRDAILIMADGEGIGISKRRITLSTSGVVPNIERAGAEIGCMLAISLHAVRDELRNELVPLNRKYPIAQLMEACRNYPGASNAKRITFEYVMLKDVNDSIEDAKALVRLLKGIPAKINLIPFNPWPGTKYECSDWDQIEKFSQVVFDAGYASPVRTPRGRDIFAACGQLKSATEKMSARERMALRAMAMVDE
jgi:23S rRNA (adenine2503-C2)-methyltransferase